MTNYQNREAKRIGLQQQIDEAQMYKALAGITEWQRKAREIRAENVRRTASAK